MVSGRGERVMCFMEGQGVDGHVGDESSPYRNTFVSVFEYVSLLSSLLSLPLLLSSRLVSSRLVSSRLVSSRLVSSRLVSSRLVSSCLVLSCLVLWCGVAWRGVLWCGVVVCVCWRVCVLACSTLSAVSLKIAEFEQLCQVLRLIGGIGNMLFSTCSQTLNV